MHPTSRLRYLTETNLRSDDLMAFFGATNDDTTLGLAYVGTVCSGSNPWKMSINDWSGSEARTGVVFAHELGNY